MLKNKNWNNWKLKTENPVQQASPLSSYPKTYYQNVSWEYVDIIKKPFFKLKSVFYTTILCLKTAFDIWGSDKM